MPFSPATAGWLPVWLTNPEVALPPKRSPRSKQIGKIGMLSVVKVRAWRVALKSQESSWLDVKKRSVKFRLAFELVHDAVPNKKGLDELETVRDLCLTCDGEGE